MSSVTVRQCLLYGQLTTVKTLRHTLGRSEMRLTTTQPPQSIELQLLSINLQWATIRAKHLEILASRDLPSKYNLEDYINMEGMPMDGKPNIPASQPATEIRWELLALAIVPRSVLIDQSNLGWGQLKKLWYLKPKLGGEAEVLIKHISVYTKNYTLEYH